MVYVIASPDSSYLSRSVNSYFQSVSSLTSTSATLVPFARSSTVIAGCSSRSSNHVFIPETLVVVVFVTTNRSEEHTSELQSRGHLVCRLLLEKKKNTTSVNHLLQNT